MTTKDILFAAVGREDNQVCYACDGTKRCWVVKFPEHPGESVLCSKCLEKQADMNERIRNGRKGAEPKPANPTA